MSQPLFFHLPTATGTPILVLPPQVIDVKNIEVKELDKNEIWVRIDNLSHHLTKNETRTLYFKLQAVLLERVEL